MGSFHLNSEKEVMETAYILSGISYGLVIARFGVRIWKRQSHLFLSDFWLAVAAINTLGYVINGVLLAKWGAFRNNYKQTPAILKVLFSQEFIFKVGLYFPKFSIVSFYHQILPKTAKEMRLCSILLGVFLVLAALATLFLGLFWCSSHITSNWSLTTGSCESWQSVLLYKIVWALNVAADIMLFIFPFPLLNALKNIGTGEKIAITATFGLGLITIGVTIGRFVSFMTGDEFRCLYIWALGELSASLIVVSLPALRVFFRKSPFRRSLPTAKAEIPKPSYPPPPHAATTVTTGNISMRVGSTSEQQQGAEGYEHGYHGEHMDGPEQGRNFSTDTAVAPSHEGIIDKYEKRMSQNSSCSGTSSKMPMQADPHIVC